MKEGHIENNQLTANSSNAHYVSSAHHQSCAWDDYTYPNFIGEEWETHWE